VIEITQNKRYHQIMPQNTSTLPIAISALIATSTNLPLAPTLAAELVREVCRLGLVRDGMLICVPMVDDAPLSEIPASCLRARY
jgi:hypothetical protein